MKDDIKLQSAISIITADKKTCLNLKSKFNYACANQTTMAPAALAIDYRFYTIGPEVSSTQNYKF